MLVKQKCIKCNSDKRSLKQKYCLVCRNKIIKNKEVCRFVKQIDSKYGYCDMADIYQMVSLWIDITKNSSKYDTLEVNDQIKNIWKDLKKIYNDSQNF